MPAATLPGQPLTALGAPYRAALPGAAGVVLLALTVMVGWHAGSVTLVQINPEFAPMQYNTALGFLLSGSGLTALCFGRARYAALAGGAAAVLGAATLAQYLGRFDLGIDQVFVHSAITTRVAHAGRMAPNTAVCFLLFGAALVVVAGAPRRESRVMVGGALSAIVLAGGLVPLAGYGLGLDSAHGWGRLAGMAVHTAAGFCLLGSALIAFAIERHHAGPEARYTLGALLVGVGGISVSLLAWLALHADHLGRLEREAATAARDAAALIGADFGSKSRAVERMAQRRAARPHMTRSEWQPDAVNCVHDIPAMTSIGWVDADLRVRWVVPRDPWGELEGFDLGSVPGRRALYAAARARDEGVAAGRAPLISGGEGMVVVAPVRGASPFPGYIASALDTERWFSRLLATYTRDGWQSAIRQGGMAVHGSDAGPAEVVAQHDFRLGGEPWSIRMALDADAVAARSSGRPALVLLGGSVMTLLLIAAIHLTGRARRGAADPGQCLADRGTRGDRGVGALHA